MLGEAYGSGSTATLLIAAASIAVGALAAAVLVGQIRRPATATARPQSRPP